MTKTIEIYNSSNWEGENFIIDFGDRMGEDGVPVKNRVVLQPGEGTQVPEVHYKKRITVEIVDHEKAKTRPFYNKKGQQLIPHIHSEFKPIIRPNPLMMEGSFSFKQMEGEESIWLLNVTVEGETHEFMVTDSEVWKKPRDTDAGRVYLVNFLAELLTKRKEEKKGTFIHPEDSD